MVLSFIIHKPEKGALGRQPYIIYHLNEQIGARIKQLRLSLGESMEQFGKRFDTSKGTVNNWEKGRNLPNKENLKKLAELGNTTVTELLYEELETGELVETNEPNIKAPCNLAEAERYYIDCLAQSIAETQDMAEKSRLTAKLTHVMQEVETWN